MSGPIQLAVFGGTPLFDRPRTIGQLFAPPLPDVLCRLERARADAVLLVEQLEAVLAVRHGVAQCVVVANAGLGLTMLMRILGGVPGEVVMPAFTFRGLPHFARWAGHDVRFCDVASETHALDPQRTAETCGARTRVILGVCNFNDTGPIAELEALSSRRGVPLIFDSVYALGATYRGRPLGGNGAAEVYSLHATKLLNGFEGGYVTTNDSDLARELRDMRSGDAGSIASVPSSADRPAFACSLNAYHAATALASLEHLPAIVAGNLARNDAYAAMISALPGLTLVPYAHGDGAAPNYELTIVEVAAPWPLTRDQTVALLRAEGVMITAYYSPPLHRPPYAHLDPLPSLPVTDALAARYLQLPGGEHVGLDDIARIGDLLTFVSRHGDEVAADFRAVIRP